MLQHQAPEIRRWSFVDGLIRLRQPPIGVTSRRTATVSRCTLPVEGALGRGEDVVVEIDLIQFVVPRNDSGWANTSELCPKLTRSGL